MNDWILLILSLPTENATVRMRAWRALKASGAAVLRDGVYVLPQTDGCRQLFDAVSSDVRAGGGATQVLRVNADDHEDFTVLFDRSEDYALLLADMTKLSDTLTVKNAADTLKQTRKLRKSFGALAAIDYFAGEAQRQAEASLQVLEAHIRQLLSPDEPYPTLGAIARLNSSDYRGRTWVTRQRPWADRLASAWLIRRYIDPQARLIWVAALSDCPADAIGFDFDDAEFTHVGAKVTFEVLLASFDLASPALQRLGALVHFLDVGGVQPNEASGIERILAGMRLAIQDDDQLLLAASGIFDGLLVAFEQEGLL